MRRFVTTPAFLGQVPLNAGGGGDPASCAFSSGPGTMDVTGRIGEAWNVVLSAVRKGDIDLTLILLTVVFTLLGAFVLVFFILFIVAPTPRRPLSSEKRFRTITSEGKTTLPQTLPCWHDRYQAQKHAAILKGESSEEDIAIEEPDLFMSLVVPAYNEEERLGVMLQEAVDYLTATYASEPNGAVEKSPAEGSAAVGRSSSSKTGWEVLVVSDGSTDRTMDTALRFAHSYKPSNSKDHVNLPEGSIRVVPLAHNRGKGGATIHGMRHVRGRYVVFADADGASKFEDLGKLVRECQKIEDGQGRGVAVGSRAHLVGSAAVVKRSFLRNLLMHSFHLLLRILTPPATAAIKDTQCGFKLFSRATLPDIVPFMHSEGWIFDVEMLMLAESAGIPVAEVPVGWKEVDGSKLNVLWDSLGMAWGLAILRSAWALGVYRR